MKQLVSKPGAGNVASAVADSLTSGITNGVGVSAPGLHTDPIKQKSKMT